MQLKSLCYYQFPFKTVYVDLCGISPGKYIPLLKVCELTIYEVYLQKKKIVSNECVCVCNVDTIETIQRETSTCNTYTNSM